MLAFTSSSLRGSVLGQLMGLWQHGDACTHLGSLPDRDRWQHSMQVKAALLDRKSNSAAAPGVENESSDKSPVESSRNPSRKSGYLLAEEAEE